MPSRDNASTIMFIRLALVALVFAVYWPAVGFGYVEYDDPDYITPEVRAGLTLANVQWAFDLHGHAANWHPVTWLSLMLDTSVLGDNAMGHHLVNIALHAGNVLLLFGLLLTMTGMTWRSAIVAGLLAVHPMHVESVAWVAERKDVLSMLFWLLTMRAYVAFTRDRRLWRYALLLAMFALGLMAKPMVVTLPLVLLLLDLWPLQRMELMRISAANARRAAALLAEKIPLLAMSLVVSRITVAVQHQSGKVVEGRWMTLTERLEMAVTGYARYLGKLPWPADLCVLYPNLAPLGIDQWSTAQVVGSAALVGAISLIAVLLIRTRPYLFVGWFWYLGTLVPVIGLVQVGRQSIADRYAYIPYVGLYVALVWLASDVLARCLSRVPATRRIEAAAAVVVTLSLAHFAHRQVGVWRDSVTLFTHAARVDDRNWLMLNNLAGVLAREGQYERALPLLDEAVAICAECAWVHQHRGEVLIQAGRLTEAQMALERAVELDPENAAAQMNLGVALARQQRPASAIAHLRRAVEIEPANADARKNLALGLALNGQTAEALEQASEALRLRPDRRDEFEALMQAIRAGAKP